ncbi:MAG: O-antigen ligase family protein [bacterium]|nr:O-antigen ligase family protein [bacterium]
MKKEYYLSLLKGFIILSPLLYGAMGRLFSPLFYALLAVLTLLGLKQPREEKPLPYKKVTALLFFGFLIFLFLQTIPVPRVLLWKLTPGTARTLQHIATDVPLFHPVSLVPFDTLILLLQVIVLALFFLVILRIRLEKQEMLALLHTIVLSAVILLLFSLTGFLRQSAGRHSLHFAFYIAMVFPLVPGLLLRHLKFFESNENPFKTLLLELLSGKRPVLLLTAAGLALAFGIVLTGSRTTQLILLLSCLLFAQWAFFFKKFSRRIRRLLRTVFVIISMLAIFITFFPIFKDLMRIDNVQTREGQKWSQSIFMLRSFPLGGVGFGTLDSIELMHQQERQVELPYHANNGYLEVLTEGGLMGGTLFLLLIGTLLFTYLQMWWHRRHPGVKIVGLGVAVSLVTASVYFIFNTAWRIPSNLLVFFLLLAIGIKVALYKHRHREHTPKPEPKQ